MASALPSRQCSQCKIAVGSFNCEGCKNIFCSKHSMEHRQELCSRFEELMTKQNITLERMQDKDHQKELLKTDLYGRIDHWKTVMFKMMCQRAEDIRREVDELIDQKHQMMINNTQSLTDEIQRRHEREDFFENDIDRIKQNIEEAQQSIEKFISKSGIELYVQAKETINWKNLIHIKKQHNSASSSVANTFDNSLPYFRSSYPTYLQQPFVFGAPPANSAFTPVARLPIQQNTTANLWLNGRQSTHQSASTSHHSPNLSNQAEKQPRKALVTVARPTHTLLEMVTPTVIANVDRISSETASANDTSDPSSSEDQKKKTQEEFRHQFAALLSNSNT